MVVVGQSMALASNWDIVMSKLLEALITQNIINENIAQDIISKTQQQKTSVTAYLVKHNLISSRDLLERIAKYFSLAIADLQHYKYQDTAPVLLSHDLIHRYRVLPLRTDTQSLTLCVADPTQEQIFSTLRFHTGKHIRLMLIDETTLDNILNTYCKPQMLLARFLAEENQPYQTERAEQNDEPIIEYVDHLINSAIEKQVSDIHVEPYAQHCRIRFRRDGLLYEAATLPSHAATRVNTRLKIMANLNIAEKRLPQDGRIPWRRESNTDIRINSCPTLHGEKIVLRLLNTNEMQLDIEALGLQINQLKQLRNAYTKPQGLILVTGPTGSGKSMTLYSILRELNQTEKNISSVEDPVEIELHGINQIHINHQIGLSFPVALRMLLRQDPDILMIGEIRDLETATIAIQAAQTGHLVLSTLHCNSAAEAIQRLQSMGVEHYQLNDSLTLTISQRLIRKLCPHCKQLTNDQHTYKATGCEHCHHGYRGRTGVFAFSESLWDAAQQKVRDGITSLAEIQRVTMECA